MAFCCAQHSEFDPHLRMWAIAGHQAKVSKTKQIAAVVGRCRHQCLFTAFGIDMAMRQQYSVEPDEKEFIFKLARGTKSPTQKVTDIVKSGCPGPGCREVYKSYLPAHTAYKPSDKTVGASFRRGGACTLLTGNDGTGGVCIGNKRTSSAK